jgi:hypothetical protein
MYTEAELNVIVDKLAERLTPVLEGMYDKTIRRKSKEKDTVTYEEAAVMIGRTVQTVKNKIGARVLEGAKGYVTKESIKTYLANKAKSTCK